MRPESSRVESAADSSTRDHNFVPRYDGFAELNPPHGFDDGTFFPIAPSSLGETWMKHLIALALIACLAASASADDKPEGKKKRAGNRDAGAWMAGNLGKTLEKVELTDEQKEKWNEAKKSFTAQVKDLREEGLTPELMKKRNDAQKEAREAGLKGKELAAKLNEGFSEEEQALFSKQQKAVRSLRASVAGMLTPEQMAALPEQARKQMTATKERGEGKGKGRGKGKGKKKDA
tara:strand:+ start:14859 stop:15557 length:699 start_codon:yes stop_codon:yes gene_type:complete